MSFRLNNRGSALVVSLVLSLVAVAFLSLYGWYSLMRSKENVSALARQKALEYADSGLNDAIGYLRQPGTTVVGIAAFTQVQPPTSTSRTNGRSEYLISTTSDPNYLTIDATGYYYFPKGSTVDKDNPLLTCQAAVVHATILFNSVTEFLAAVSNTLHIADGSNLVNLATTPPSYGAVYASTLYFDGSATLGAAYYPSQIGRYFPNPLDPSKVQFLPNTAPQAPQVIPSALNVTPITPTVRTLYQNRTAYRPPAGPVSYTGFLDEPPPEPNGVHSHVYYVPNPGGVDIGPLTVHGVYTIYAVGDIRIHGNVGPFPGNNDSWIALVSEHFIHLANDAPDQLTLVGNFVANGGMKADPPQLTMLRDTGGATSANCQLSITGGMVGEASPNFSDVWTSPCTRNYTYKCYKGNNYQDLYLPNLSTIQDYKIIQGRYR